MKIIQYENLYFLKLNFIAVTSSLLFDLFPTDFSKYPIF